MKELRFELTINAPAEMIWDTLTALESFQEWNPFIRRAGGIVEVLSTDNDSQIQRRAEDRIGRR